MNDTRRGFFGRALAGLGAAVFGSRIVTREESKMTMTGVMMREEERILTLPSAQRRLREDMDFIEQLNNQLRSGLLRGLPDRPAPDARPVFYKRRGTPTFEQFQRMLREDG